MNSGFGGRLAVLLACLPCFVAAQETRGKISGTVLDAQSAVVAGAPVVVTNTDTNTSVNLITNNSGYYEAPLLLPGNYQVAVEMPGFKKSVRTRLTLALSGQLAIDFLLEVGAVKDSITIAADSPILETTAMTTGRVMTTRELMDLPVLTNNIVLMARLAPGVQVPGTTQYLSQGMIGGSSGYSAAGGVGGNEWTVDGAPNNGASRNTAFTPYTDMVGEFKVETSNFDASFGHSSGLNIEMSSKSGGNQFHGTATEQYWNTRWNAAPFFVKQNYYRNIAQARASGNNALADDLASRPITTGGHSNNYGGTFGGPIHLPKIIDGRNKLFFFLSYSGAKDRQPARASEITDTVPTVAMRQGDFSQLLVVDASRYQMYDPLTVRADPARATHYIRTPFPGNIIPASRMNNPMNKFYSSRVPVPNNDPLDPRKEPTNNFLATGMPDNTDYRAWQARTDYQLSPKHRFFFRMNLSHFIEDAMDHTYAIERGFMSQNDNRDNLSGVVDWTYAKSPATVIDVSVASNQWWQRYFNDGLLKYKPSDAGLPGYMDAVCAASQCSVPVLTTSGYLTISRGLNTYPKERSQGVKLNISHIRGSHTLQAGIDFRQHYRTDIGAGGNSAGNFSFSNSYTRKDDDGNQPTGTIGYSWAAFLLGLPNGITIDNNASLAEINPYYGWFAQDSWRLTRNLTVTLGLRMEYELGPTERYNRAITAFDPTAQLPIAAAAQAAYAASPLAELAAASFVIQGGNTYAGVNGAPRHLWQNQLMWLPRVSVAWQFHSKMVFRAGYGSYYDTLNVMNEAANQAGYSRATSTTVTNDFGVNWLVGNPLAGVSPLADPFPVRSDGTRFDTPFGNSLGSMYSAGRGFSFLAFDRLHPRVQRWRAGIQRELSGNMLVEASYWGQWSDDIGVSKKIDALPQQYWATGIARNDAVANDLNRNVANPYYIGNFTALRTSSPVLYQQMSTIGFFTSTTIRKNQLLRPYSHMNGLNNSVAPVGKNKIHAIELNFTRRFARGFNVNASYTHMTARDKTIFNNEFDSEPTWYGSNTSRPTRFTASGIYEFPFGKGRAFWKHGILNYAFGGWQTAVTYEYQPGALLTWGNNFYYGDLNNLSTDLTSGPKTLDQWFNTSAPFERNSAKGPAAFALRVFPVRIDGLRGDKLSQWNGNLRRDFRITERMKFEIRMDALNLQNRSQFNDPDMNAFSTTFGKIISQTASTNRFYQIQGRIQF